MATQVAAPFLIAVEWGEMQKKALGQRRREKKTTRAAKRRAAERSHEQAQRKTGADGRSKMGECPEGQCGKEIKSRLTEAKKGISGLRRTYEINVMQMS